MAGLEGEMKHLLQPAAPPVRGACLWGAAWELSWCLTGDGGKWLFLQWAKGNGASWPLTYGGEGR